MSTVSITRKLVRFNNRLGGGGGSACDQFSLVPKVDTMLELFCRRHGRFSQFLHLFGHEDVVRVGLSSLLGGLDLRPIQGLADRLQVLGYHGNGRALLNQLENLIDLVND